jgi:quercetin dioxygenase-like cupin family protein
MNNDFRHIPRGRALHKIGPDEGQIFDIAGVRFAWKVKGEDTGYAFSMYEQVLNPGEGVPLHCHPYVEVFYVLSGTVDYLRVTDDGEDWIACAVGETIIVPTNALHSFYNRMAESARHLCISTQLHQAFFDAVEEADRSSSFAALSDTEAMGHISQLARRFDMHFFPLQPPAPRR